MFIKGNNLQDINAIKFECCPSILSLEMKYKPQKITIEDIL